jgi:endoglucanase
MPKPKTKLFFTTAVFILLLAACVGTSAVQVPVSFLDHVPNAPYTENEYPLEPLSGKTAFEYFRDERILAGWNLGNTLDSHSSEIGNETIWGNPRVNQELMNGIKAAGFDVIRIPVTWMGHIGNAPDHRITSLRLRRVAEVVGMARNAGLKVILNAHHDGATDSTRGDLGWLSIRRASRSQNEFNEITTRYVRMWVQIATYFRNYGDWLIFEGFNELHDGNWSSGGDPGQFITLTRWNQLFVDAVRSTGGNNEERFLIISPYVKCPRQLLSPGFMMPEDTAQGKLIVSFHYYDPYEFGIASTRAAWGTPADRQRTDADFAPFKERFIDNNIQVIIGECGAVLQLHPNDPAREAEARRSRMEYIPHIFSTARKYGLVPIYWDNGSIRGTGEKFGLFDRSNGQPNSPDSDALIRLMIDAVR